MEEQANHRDLLGHVVRPPSLRTGSLKATLSGRITPRNSPSFRRSQSGRTPRKEVRVYSGPLQWLRGRRLLPWLILLGIWSYVGFHVQSKWAHNTEGDEPGLTVFGSRVEVDQGSGNHGDQAVKKLDTLEDGSSVFPSNNSSEHINKLFSYVKKPHLGHRSPVNLNRWFWRRKQGLEQGKRGDNVQQESSSNSSFKQTVSSKHVEESLPNRTLHENVVTKNMRTTKLPKGRDKTSVTGNDTMPMNIIGETEHMDARVKRNTSYGLLVGPFDKTEDRVLGWNSGKRYSTCNRKGSFAHIVRGRSFIVVLHELSMTGAPLAMMELATEILSCGGRVSAIALSRKGGLMGELSRRGIKLLKDKSVGSFRTAMKADIVIAGSAVSALWIEHYLLQYKRASDKLIWWIMENRRQYFDRSKHMLQKVKALVFLSELQSQQWLAWCAEEGIKLPSTLEVVPLSVNDELAFVAGLQTALNTPLYSVERMLEKRKALREEVRSSMGLDPNDMLVMTLSSINPGKGQLILLKAALMIVDENFIPKINPDHVESMETSKNASDGETSKNVFGGEDPIVKNKGISRVLSELSNIDEGGKYDSSKTIAAMASWKQDPVQNASYISTPSNLTYSSRTENLNRGQQTRKLLADMERNRNQTLKLLIGSVGSKSNKVPYIKSMLGFISHHPELARLMLWTPTTVHVAPLYAAADVYVINAQGIGETFGRVTIEAMTFGLPVLGTDAGGTTEIVENNVTGLLHPVGQKGVHVLSQHIRFLLKNQALREEMGWKGREKVEKLFLKHHMYDKLAEILKKCMRQT